MYPLSEHCSHQARKRERARSATDARDRALLLGGGGAFRRSALVVDAEGLAVMIRHDKTGQEGRGRAVFDRYVRAAPLGR